MKKQLIKNFEEKNLLPLNKEEMKKVLGGLAEEEEDDEEEVDLEAGGYCPTIIYSKKTGKQIVKHDC